MRTRMMVLTALTAIVATLPMRSMASHTCDKASLAKAKTVISSVHDSGTKEWVGCYAPGAGFSAVYDLEAREFVAIAIDGKATLTNGKEASGQKVSQYGGHKDVANALRDETHKKDNKDFAGFWFNVVDGPALELGWTSGTINDDNFGDHAVPSKYRSEIRSLVERVTGLDAH